MPGVEPGLGLTEKIGTLRAPPAPRGLFRTSIPGGARSPPPRAGAAPGAAGELYAIVWRLSNCRQTVGSSLHVPSDKN